MPVTLAMIPGSDNGFLYIRTNGEVCLAFPDKAVAHSRMPMPYQPLCEESTPSIIS